MTTIEITGAGAIQAELEKLDGRDRQNLLRRAVRAATKPFIAAMKAAAMFEHVPRSFQKVPAAKISTQRGASGREVGATVRPASPLFNIFEPGAKAHTISGDFLFGVAGGSEWTDDGRKRPDVFAAHGSVTHPGMAARPLIPEAFETGQLEAQRLFLEAIFAGTSAGAES